MRRYGEISEGIRELACHPGMAAVTDINVLQSNTSNIPCHSSPVREHLLATTCDSRKALL